MGILAEIIMILLPIVLILEECFVFYDWLFFIGFPLCLIFGIAFFYNKEKIDSEEENEKNKALLNYSKYGIVLIELITYSLICIKPVMNQSGMLYVSLIPYIFGSIASVIGYYFGIKKAVKNKILDKDKINFLFILLIIIFVLSYVTGRYMKGIVNIEVAE